MKRAFAAAAALFMLLPLLCSAENIRLHPGESVTYSAEVISPWVSEDSDVADASENVITAYSVGTAVLSAEAADGSLYSITVEVSDETQAMKMPPLMQAAVDLGLAEWEAAGGETFRRCNKYTLWYSNGNKYEYGWCAAFECWCLYHVGIPMVEWTKCEPHENGDVWGVKANGVGKVIQGYDKMNRLTFIPRPGYLVVYGQADSGTCMHVAIITDCEEIGEGRYLIKTVEGNMANRIKRYCYVYEVKGADESKANGKKNYPYKVTGNYFDAPEEYRTEPDTFQYTKHKKNWYVYRFCATWLPQETAD